MQKELLAEIKELKTAISTLIGTSDLLPEEQFSKEALAKAAKQFQKLSIERGEWVNDSDMVSNSFTEHSTDGSIKPYAGKSIVLPIQNTYYPSLENLQWHRENIFKN